MAKAIGAGSTFETVGLIGVAAMIGGIMSPAEGGELPTALTGVSNIFEVWRRSSSKSRVDAFTGVAKMVLRAAPVVNVFVAGALEGVSATPECASSQAVALR